MINCKKLVKMWISPEFKHYAKLGLKLLAILYLADKLILPSKRVSK